ncbi:hypothetical protein IAR55_001816 [Kwoniella newhampshirensis]|uniref:Histone deacetylase domain-containing protein n=1 Tax=Kwoniella newhampshirensis TaxID=1651941 RepID=A0AAW0Z3A8_9TREE
MTITRSQECPVEPVKASSSTRRVAYIWSKELQDVADDLPSNVGRSSMVHGLVESLGLLNHTHEEDQEEDTAHEIDANRAEDGHASQADEVDDSAHVDIAPAGRSSTEQEKGTGSTSTNASSSAVDVSQPVTNTKDDIVKLRSARVRAPDLSLGTKACLLRYHDKAYVERLLKSQPDDDHAPDDPTQPPSPPASSSSSSSSPEAYPRPRKMARTDRYNLSHDNPVFSTLPGYISLIASATSTACRLLAQDRADWTIVWDGGRHHAKRAEAGGFCYVNDLVLGILLLTREGRITLHPSAPSTNHVDGERKNSAQNRAGKTKTRPPRIMYLDLDLHYSDGVSLAFHSPTKYPYPLPTSHSPKPPNVLTLSVHHSSPIFFPPPTPPSLLPSSTTSSPFSLSIPLKAYPSNSTYRTVFEDCIEPVAKAWNPDYVVLQLGTDGLPGDRVGQYGNWGVEGPGGMKWVVERIKSWKELRVKVCVTGGGGYKHENAARAWASVTSVLLDRKTDAETPIPHHERFEEYAPSFTMEVPEGTFESPARIVFSSQCTAPGHSFGHMRDENTQQDLDKAIEVYTVIADRIREIVRGQP